METRKGYVTIEEGLRLAYRWIGSGPQTVVVPGAVLLADDLDGLANPERRLLFYDMRGRGGSDLSPDPWLPWTEYETSDLDAIRRAFGQERITLLGWSYMGAAAVRYALDYPGRVERLVLVCPIPIRHPAPYIDPVAQNELAVSRLDAEGIRQLEEMRLSGQKESDPVAFARLYSRVYMPRQLGNRSAMERQRSQPWLYPNEWPDQLATHWRRHFPDEGWTRDWRAEARGLNVPTLVIQGSEDLLPVEAARDWAGCLPDARLLLMPGSGHFPFLEDPQRFFPAVDQFLAGSWPDDAEVVLPT